MAITNVGKCEKCGAKRIIYTGKDIIKPLQGVVTELRCLSTPFNCDEAMAALGCPYCERWQDGMGMVKMEKGGA